MTAADHVFAELDPDAAEFAERFRRLPSRVEAELDSLVHDLGVDLVSTALWRRVLYAARAIRDLSVVPELHVESARDHLRALRAMRDREHVIAQQAVELTGLRQRLIESARPVEPVPGLEEVRGG